MSNSAGATLAAVVIAAQDANGNVATSFAGPVTVSLGTTTAGAVLGGTLTVNAVAGVATFSTLTVNKNSAGYTLLAAAAGTHERYQQRVQHRDRRCDDHRDHGRHGANRHSQPRRFQRPSPCT